MIDHLCDPCAAAFERVQVGLRSLDIGFVVRPRLVRGLDYYRRTTFEFAATALEGAQDAVGGGGRYDGLAELLGGPPTPGIGFGVGIERILLRATPRVPSRPRPPPSTPSSSTSRAGTLLATSPPCCDGRASPPTAPSAVVR
jgi:histidyl-tRNA synthetase